MWWSERACTRTLGALVRPDGFGRWREADRAIDFFLEYDTGSESLTKVLAKLDGYEALAAATGRSSLVLFWLHSHRRETELHRKLPAGGVPVATASVTPQRSTRQDLLAPRRRPRQAQDLIDLR